MITIENKEDIKVFLLEEHQVMRDGLKILLSNQPGISVVGEADNFNTTEELVKRAKPNIITVGMNINGCNYFDIVKTLSKDFPDIRIIAHSAYIEKSFVSEMLKAGSCAYVHKNETFTEIVKAIESAIKGDVYLCPRVANIVMNSYLNEFSHKDTSIDASLTERERDVLRLLANGKSSKEIALELYISTKTVDTHRRQIMNKVNLFSVPELTKYAIRCGLTSIN